MEIHQNFSLQPYNTFGINAMAKWFASFNSVEALQELFSHKPLAINYNPSNIQRLLLILGGGSNVLFSKNYEGLILKNELKGIELLREDETHFYVKANAGENWHQLVLYCIEHNYAGMENLSLIPGNVGASPMQNIGAYGVEIKDVFEELEAYHIDDKAIVKFNLQDCEFGYRESVFKKKYKGQFVILNVTYKLNKKPVYHTSYGAIEAELEKMQVKDISIQAISQAVINIRKSKLPDPNVIGNAGSFFKNPTISNRQFKQLKEEFPDIVGYRFGDTQTKVAAGWLIEYCGWKGYREGDAGVHVNQALVLVNYGSAAGREIYELSEKIIQSVRVMFEINLEREVNII